MVLKIYTKITYKKRHVVRAEGLGDDKLKKNLQNRTQNEGFLF